MIDTILILGNVFAGGFLAGVIVMGAFATAGRRAGRRREGATPS